MLRVHPVVFNGNGKMRCECRKDVRCTLQCYLTHVILSHVISHDPTVKKEIIKEEEKKKRRKYDRKIAKNFTWNILLIKIRMISANLNFTFPIQSIVIFFSKQIFIYIFHLKILFYSSVCDLTRLINLLKFIKF